MFYQIRYQTGEIDDVVKELKKGNIPCMDVESYEELEWVFEQLRAKGISRAENVPYDKSARDRIAEPEFEFRIAFYESDSNQDSLRYIDFYFEPIIDETYDNCGEM
ncbi:MAG: hypothetical protein N2484_10645 [Clostridia bacterium]|nr:hypothetical protein [Clostridia bacterium]